MLRTFSFVSRGMVAFAALLLVAGCSTSSPTALSEPVESAVTAPTGGDKEHGHKVGAHGGMIVPLGRDSYHVEAYVTKAGELRLYTLGNDESQVMEVEIQALTAHVKLNSSSEYLSVPTQPQAQPGDAEGKTSLFVAELPESLVGQSLDVVVPNFVIGGKQFRLSFTTQAVEHGADAMPAKVADEAEKNLYLTPGGLYTQADIEANGNVTVSQKFATFQAAHDLNPKVGDKICPVTLTKANPQCSWIIGGKTYEFCCPPCVDEFVKLAKSNPKDVKQPDQYVKRQSATGSELK